MKRWTFNILAILSLVLCLAALAAWAHSYWYYDIFRHRLIYHGEGGTDFDYFGQEFFVGESVAFTWQAGQHTGVWFIETRNPRWIPDVVGEWEYAHVTHQKTYLDWDDFKWFSWFRFSYDPTDLEVLEVAMPHWVVVVAFSILPIIWFVRYRKRKRFNKLGCCKKCGYSLKYNTTGECPECGESNEL